MLDLENVSKIYPGGNVALRNISIHIDPGEFVFIVGPSGAGKSTFLRILSGKLEPTSGEIAITPGNECAGSGGVAPPCLCASQ